jgi:ribonucleoside-diphosphate reductase alpha chain
MGWADLLIKLRIPYDSDVAVELGAEIMQTIQAEADKASIVLGMKRGNFPDFASSIYADTYPALRNATRTTIAPTGTISIIAGCSSGIEPLFALQFTRSHYLDKDPNKRHEMVEFHPALAEWLDKQDVPNQQLPAHLVTAQEISPAFHVRMQAAFQKYTDNAVSKTINFRKDATVEEVEKAYLTAWVTGCSGITVYRDGSRENQVLRVEEKVEKSVPTIPDKRQRLDTTRTGIIHKFSVGEFEGYITVGLYRDGTPGEVYIIGNRTGSTTRGYLDTIGLLFSLALQYGAPLDKVVEKLTGTRFEPSGITGNGDIPVATSVVDYISRWLRREFIDKGTSNEYTKQPTGDMCPECDAPLFYGSGCSECISCGYSKCG